MVISSHISTKTHRQVGDFFFFSAHGDRCSETRAAEIKTFELTPPFHRREMPVTSKVSEMPGNPGLA